MASRTRIMGSLKVSLNYAQNVVGSESGIWLLPYFALDSATSLSLRPLKCMDLFSSKSRKKAASAAAFSRDMLCSRQGTRFLTYRKQESPLSPGFSRRMEHNGRPSLVPHRFSSHYNAAGYFFASGKHLLSAARRFWPPVLRAEGAAVS